MSSRAKRMRTSAASSIASAATAADTDGVCSVRIADLGTDEDNAEDSVSPPVVPAAEPAALAWAWRNLASSR